jgi:hypothetical protein
VSERRVVEGLSIKEWEISEVGRCRERRKKARGERREGRRENREERK